MIITRSARAAADRAGLKNKASVVTIGNFDGIHIGHQAMLKAAREQADKRGLPLVVMSFDPHPQAYFAPQIAIPRLDSFAERVVALRNLGVNVACIVPFDRRLAQMSPADFVEQILIKQLNAKCVVIGDDFQYGKQRSGNAQTLALAAKTWSFDVVRLNTVLQNTERASSTTIRQLLEKGQFETAELFLDKKYSMMGRVLHGDKRGRSWGFPTMNLTVHYERAVKGVFAVQVQGLANKALNGVANLGQRPTVDGLKTLLEVHLFDWQQEVYGQRICVEFCHQIRHERKFDSFLALKNQIQKDICTAKDYFNQHLVITTNE